jgi:hypothetical protein
LLHNAARQLAVDGGFEDWLGWLDDAGKRIANNVADADSATRS